MDWKTQLNEELAAVACDDCGHRGLTLMDVVGHSDWLRPWRDAHGRVVMRLYSLVLLRCPRCGGGLSIRSTTLGSRYQEVACGLRKTLQIRSLMSRIEAAATQSPDTCSTHGSTNDVGHP